MPPKRNPPRKASQRAVKQEEEPEVVPAPVHALPRANARKRTAPEEVLVDGASPPKKIKVKEEPAVQNPPPAAPAPRIVQPIVHIYQAPIVRQIDINRAPVLALWSAVCAVREGHSWDTARTLSNRVKLAI